MKLAFYFVFVSILTKEACSLFLCVFDSFLYSTLCLFVCNTKLIFYLLIVRKTIYSNMIIFMCCFQAYLEVFFPFSGYSLKLNYSSFIFPSAVYLPIMQRLFVPTTYSFLFPFIVLFTKASFPLGLAFTTATSFVYLSFSANFLWPRISQSLLDFSPYDKVRIFAHCQ